MSSRSGRLEAAASLMAKALVEDVVPADRVARARLIETMISALRMMFIRIYADPTFGPYRYLTAHHKLIYAERMGIAKGHCERCGRKHDEGDPWGRLVMHHGNVGSSFYRDLGEYPGEIEWVRMLCLTCHNDRVPRKSGPDQTDLDLAA